MDVAVVLVEHDVGSPEEVGTKDREAVLINSQKTGVCVGHTRHKVAERNADVLAIEVEVDRSTLTLSRAINNQSPVSVSRGRRERRNKLAVDGRGKGSETRAAVDHEWLTRCTLRLSPGIHN